MLEQVLAVFEGGGSVDRESPAYLAGQITPLILLLAGAVKCYSISRRPTTNSKSCLALMLVLGAWALGVLPVVSTTLGYRPWALYVIVGIVSLLALLLTPVLAIMGLSEMRARPGQWNQGRKQAILALVLIGTVFCAAGYGFYSEVRRARAVPDAVRVARPAADPFVRNEEFNFAFELPEAPWVQVDAKKFNPEATLAVARARPNIFFMLIAEDTGSKGVALDNDMLAEIVRVNMASAAVPFEIVDQRPRTVNDLPGIQIHARATMPNGTRLSYGYWVCARNGFAYQCVTSGETALEEQVLRDAEELSRRFRVIDPKRSTRFEPQRPLEPPRRI